MNYVAIIGDIKSSKTINKRNQIQEKLNIILKHINETYSPDIAAKFIITLGDEFQGLLKNYDHILDIAKYIQREMYPVNLRFGIGFGKIYTDIFCEAAIGSDGPAYYAAREMVKQLREQEKKLRKQTADIQISIYNAKSFEIVKINTILNRKWMVGKAKTYNLGYGNKWRQPGRMCKTPRYYAVYSCTQTSWWQLFNI